MRFLPIDLVTAGMKTGKTIYNEKGIPLLYKGSILNESYIEKLRTLGYQGLLIDDEISKDVEYEENFISQELKFSISQKLHDSFVKTVDGKYNVSNITDLKSIIEDVLDKMISSKEITLNLLELKMFDNYTYFHSINVSIISLVLGYHWGMNAYDLKDLGLAALLHDVGKMFISTDLLNKPGKLTEEEFEIMKKHSYKGYENLRNNPMLNTRICVAILSHHEHYDGSGYPNKLFGEKISLWGRIICIADVYDALTSDRPYRKAHSHSNVIEYIMANTGQLFDPKLVTLFISKIYPYPVGSVIQLSNKETALVIENTTMCLRPIVKILEDERKIDLLNDMNYISVTIVGLLTNNQDDEPIEN